MLSFFPPRKALGLLILAGLLAGCNFSTRYPGDLRYPVRKDIIVKKEPAAEPDVLPSPGRLDESIVAAIAADKEAREKALDPAKLTAEQRKSLRAGLYDAFGSPMRPKVASSDTSLVSELMLDNSTLARGSELYRKHCMHCHGVSGDGRGPTGPWVHPHPRDYRSGTFKFISTLSEAGGKSLGRRPSRADLLRTLSKGIDGTSMPAFGILPDSELQELISYVIHLSIRGDVEIQVIEELLKPNNTASTPEAVAELIDKKLNGEPNDDPSLAVSGVLELWAIVNQPGSILKPAAYPERYAGDKKDEEMHSSIRRGLKLFTSVGGCLKCHADYGRHSKYRYDVWGTLVQPRNLTAGQFRGGRRPIDLYWRIKNGVGGSGMPSLPTEVPAEGAWDLVHFVQAVPYPQMLPPDVREKVYGASLAAPKKKKDH